MSDEEWIGRIIDGRYIVEGVLGSGGMGVVLRARHKFTGATMAVKVLKPNLAADPEIQHRFLAEARAANTINHPNIVQVVDAGCSPDGVLYLVMELLVGRSLRIPLARGELKPTEMRSILFALLDALAAAHARGFIHRDLKPENVFLANGTAKLLDFGIAKVVNSNVASVRTATGSMLGTPAYMSPEQIDNPSTVDARTDLWAIGVMVFEMLTGHLPFAGTSIGELMVSVATQPPRSIRTFLPTASPQLEQFFATALARSPAARFASALEMRAALEQVLGTPTGATPAYRSPPNPTPGYATPPSGMPHAGTQLDGRAGASAGAMTQATGYATPPGAVPGYAHVGATGGTPAYTGPGAPAFPTGTAASAGGSNIVPRSSKTPLVIAIVGGVGIIAIVLAVVLTRRGATTDAPTNGSNAPNGPVATNAPPNTAPINGTNAAPTNGTSTAINGTGAPNSALNSGTNSALNSGTSTANNGTNSAANNGTNSAANNGTNSRTNNTTNGTNAPTNGTNATNSATRANNATTAKAGIKPEDPYADPMRSGPAGSTPGATSTQSTTTPPTTTTTATTPTTPSNTTTPTTSTPGSHAPGATPSTAPGATPSTAPGATLALDERCQAGCTAARTCGLATTTCIADCKANAVVRTCTDLALAKKCGEAAMCGMRATCGAVQLGQNTCKAAMTCQSSFCGPNDFACGCKCMHNIAARNVLPLLRVDVCAANCGYDENCIKQRCMLWAQTCFAQ